MMRLTLVIWLALGCNHDPYGTGSSTHPKSGDLPPLPPSSGTPVGYLIDAQTDLKLRDDQLKKLKDIDGSLGARDAEIDSQLRQIDARRAEEQEPPQPGQKRPHHNNAPGSSGRPTGDAAKLHGIRDSNDRDALKQAWAVLDPDQQARAKKLLEDRGVEVPGAPKKQDQTSDDGTPVPGMEP
jgi:hypothetical protein